MDDEGRKPRKGPRREGGGPPRARKPQAAPAPGRRERSDEGAERIAKRLARAGIASRRDAEAMIAAGRVSVNGKVLASPAFNVGPRDRIEVDGKQIPDIERTRLFLFHKPAGAVTTSRDPEGRRTVFDLLPPGLPRLVTIGRLDINTEGLLLLTNDGGLARVLELPATGWLRRYRVRVHGKVDPAALQALAEGVAVDGVFYGAVEATLDREQGSNAWLTVGLREGKNREVKNIMATLGLDVTRLIRVSFGPFQLGDLAEGELRELKGRYLRDQLGPRLIEEAGVDFDAPVLNEPSAKQAAPAREKTLAEEGGRPRPNKGREKERRREDALGRLSTTSPARRGERPQKSGPREDEPSGPRRRSSNVWMAPGARPLGEKQLARKAEATEGKRYAGKPRPQGGGAAKAGARPARSGPSAPGGKRGGPGGERGPRGPRKGGGR